MAARTSTPARSRAKQPAAPTEPVRLSASARRTPGGAKKQAPSEKTFTNLDEDDIAELKEAFDRFDKTQEGVMRPEDLPVLVRSLGYNPAESSCRQMLVNVQLTEENMVTFASFLHACIDHMTPQDAETEILAAWQVLDAQGHGFITSGQLYHVMTNLGEKLSQEEVDEMIREADPTGTGSIDYSSFTKILLASQFNVWRPPVD